MAVTNRHHLIGLALIVTIAAAGACRRTPDGQADDTEPEVEALSVTRWTAKTEVFAEYPPLVVGETSRFAIHLTRLDTFKAVTAGRVEVRLTGGSEPAEVFAVDGPSRPGIFGVDVKPSRAGSRQLVIRLQSSGVDDEHRVDEVTVHADAGAARAAATAPEEMPGIGFLKEQQWTLEFGTALVAEAALRETFRVPGRVEPRPGGAADVAAPTAGRLVRVADLAAGGVVGAGHELARLLPSAATPGDLPRLQGALAEATTSLGLATRDRQRAERLTTAGAAPGRRLDEARAAEDQAKARLRAAEASLAQYTASRSGGSGSVDGLFVIRAPISGVIAWRDATAGANVEAGAVLFHVVDPAQAYVVGQVPEGDATRVGQAAGAELEVPATGQRVPLARVVSRGKVVDPRTRTVPITFALDNRRLEIPIGQAVALHLLMAEAPPRPVVPAAAIVDDAGRPIVFVQREGEVFERRAVTIGPRSGALVQVLDGLEPGERVVTRGAYLVRLASLSTSVPAHGHVH